MILTDGKLYESSMQREVLNGLARKIDEIRAGEILRAETVIAAVEILREKILSGAFDERIDRLADSGIHGAENLRERIAQAMELLKRESLEYKLWVELDAGPQADQRRRESVCAAEGRERGEERQSKQGGDGAEQKGKLRKRVLPLGTLFHIAAGNMDGLPVYSVLEGLLAGNVNILKLPQADRGLSVEILQELLKIEPGLAPYIHVFDTPSEDIAAMRKMADLSDGIVVWGGDETVRAVRRLAGPGVKLIEWGHRLGFAYLSGYEDREREMTALAEHIAKTRQLLCSSCQVIYLDTEDMEEVHGFCREFLPYLQTAVDGLGLRDEETAGTRGEISLRRYSDILDRILEKDNPGKRGGRKVFGEGQRVYCGRGCSLTALTDSGLECSYLFGNCLVKRLPRNRILAQLRRYKGYLQTVGLICESERREELTDVFAACGLTRIMRAGSQSDAFVGEAHDGEYALRRYVRVVDIEI